MNETQWQELIIERHGIAPPLSDDQFRSWMTGRHIFISSVMDAEMNPDRLALRSWVRSWGATPVMWEEFTPRDERAAHAYLDGVDRSQLFLLLLGTSFGISDADGASPTYRENEQAALRGLPRLLFLKDGVSDVDRDPKLTRWIRSLYNEISAARYRDPVDLTQILEQRLRETASAQESPWIKLGPIIFPGKVRKRIVSGETQFTVTASVRERRVRVALGELSGWQRRAGTDRLTSGFETWPIEVVETEIDSQKLSSDEVILTCRSDARRSDGGMGFGSFTDHTGRSAGPADQAVMWADQALFGGPRPSRQSGLSMERWVAPEGPTLPEIIAREDARAWLAEGLVRLYTIEGLVKKFGGQFDRLDVGPATANGVRVDAVFQPGGHSQATAAIRGIVPIPN